MVPQVTQILLQAPTLGAYDEQVLHRALWAHFKSTSCDDQNTTTPHVQFEVGAIDG